MAKLRFSLTLIPALILATVALGQPTPRRPVAIEPLLRNSDPRLVALGAWEVLRREDDSFIPLMQQMVERWNPELTGDSDQQQFDAMTVLLDVLIQRNAQVSLAGVTAIAPAFPDQALILAERLPPGDGLSLLLTWYQDGLNVNHAHPDADGAKRLLRARVAAMMLAKSDPQLIAASLLADSVEYLAVSVPTPGSTGVNRCLVGCQPAPLCADELVVDPVPGWPPVFEYTLEENVIPVDSSIPARRAIGPLLLEAGGDRITYSRVKAEVLQNHCHSPAPLNAVNLHHLLAEMLGVTEAQMNWGAQVNLTISWQDDPQFLLDLGNQVNAEEDTLRAAVQAFYAKGLISKSQAESIRPRLSVTVFDDRLQTEPKSAPLPKLIVHDPRTTCRIRPSR
jgi:hypothetical protein